MYPQKWFDVRSINPKSVFDTLIPEPPLRDFFTFF